MWSNQFISSQSLSDAPLERAHSLDDPRIQELAARDFQKEELVDAHERFLQLKAEDLKQPLDGMGVPILGKHVPPTTTVDIATLTKCSVADLSTYIGRRA